MKKLSIIYNMTSACPWNCSICCMSAGKCKDVDELTLEQKNEVVDMIIRLSKVRDVRCDISGGELLTDIHHLELLEKLSKGIGKEKVGISISGAYLTDKIAESLARIVSDVELTLDCIPDIQYPLRPSGYHKVAADAALLLKQYGIRVGIQTVLTKDNCNLEMMETQLEWMSKNDIDNWSFIKFFPVGKGENYPEKGISHSQWLWYQENLEKRVHLWGTKAPELDYHYLMPNHQKSSRECRCVKRSIGILPNGMVTSCFWGLNSKRQPLNPRFVLGWIPGEYLEDILNSDRAKYWETQKHKCCLFEEESENGILLA